MQNRYVGDVGDFGKYGLLRTLCGRLSHGTKLSLGIVWYLTINEDHNDDGMHVSYLSNESMRECDAELFDVLKKLVERGRRSIAQIQNSDLFLQDTVFYDLALGYQHKPPGQRHSKQQRQGLRNSWLDGALNETRDKDIVFLDPDNGFEVKSVPIHSLKSNKYVYWHEAGRFLNRGNTVVIYHHLNRTMKADEQIRQKMEEFEYLLPSGATAIPILFRRGSLRVFFVFPSKAHCSLISARLDSMMRGPWAQHMELINGA